MKTSTMHPAHIPYKPPFAPQHGWFSYGLVLVILLTLLLVLGRAIKPRHFSKSTVLRLIEKKSLNGQTTLYLMEYQQQRFLLADKPNALLIHPIKHEGGVT
jgi:flagellar biogenesis protein FliO